MRFGGDGVEKQVVRNKMIRFVLGNDDVESTLAEGNMGKERQKLLKGPKQLVSITTLSFFFCVFLCFFELLCFFFNYHKIELFQIPTIDVEQRSCASASHLYGCDVDQTFVEHRPAAFRGGVKCEIHPQPRNKKRNTW